MTLKECTPIDHDEDGELILDIDSDAMNANWMRAARLKKTAREGNEEARKELERLDHTTLYEYATEDEGKDE